MPGGVSSIPAWGVKILCPQVKCKTKQNKKIKQKQQYCNKFNKRLKKINTQCICMIQNLSLKDMVNILHSFLLLLSPCPPPPSQGTTSISICLSFQGYLRYRTCFQTSKELVSVSVCPLTTKGLKDSQEAAELGRR